MTFMYDWIYVWPAGRLVGHFLFYMKTVFLIVTITRVGALIVATTYLQLIQN